MKSPLHLNLIIWITTLFCLLTVATGCLENPTQSQLNSPSTRKNKITNSSASAALESEELESLEEPPEEPGELDEIEETENSEKKILGKKLGFQIVSPLTSDPSKPDIGALLPSQLFYGNSLVKVQLPIQPQSIPNPQNPSNLFLIKWPIFILNDHEDQDPIVSANYTYDVIDFKNQTYTVQRPTPATADYSNKIWYVSSLELNQALSRAAYGTELSDTHLLRLDLVFGSGGRKQLDVRFKMKSQ